MYRWLAVVDDRWVIVCDSLSAPEPHEYQWLLHSDAEWSETGPGAFTLTADEDTLQIRLFGAPGDLVTRVEDDKREKSEGRRLVASLSEPAATGRYVAVFAGEALPEISVSTDDARIEVEIDGGPKLGFDVESGEVAVER
jgi:hypothetical protein